MGAVTWGSQGMGSDGGTKVHEVPWPCHPQRFGRAAKEMQPLSEGKRNAGRWIQQPLFEFPGCQAQLMLGRQRESWSIGPNSTKHLSTSLTVSTYLSPSLYSRTYVNAWLKPVLSACLKLSVCLRTLLNQGCCLLLTIDVSYNIHISGCKPDASVFP